VEFEPICMLTVDPSRPGTLQVFQYIFFCLDLKYHAYTTFYIVVSFGPFQCLFTFYCTVVINCVV